MNYISLLFPSLSLRRALIASVGLLAVVAALAMWLSEKESTSTDVSGEVPVEVSDSTGTASAASRYTYFSALAEVDGAVGLYSYAYDWELGAPVMVSPYDGDYALTALDDHHVLYIGRDYRIPDSGVPHFWRLMWGDYQTTERGFITVPDGWNERDVAAHPEGEYIAYAQQPNLVPPETEASLDTWEVIVINPAQSILQRIPGATSPHWVPGTEQLVYLKADGVYQYDVNTQVETLVYRESGELGQSADLALSYDGAFAVITHPAKALLQVIQINDEGSGLVYQEVLGDSDVAFHPVFDRASHNYVTVSFDLDGRPTLHIRDVQSARVLRSATLGDFVKQYFTLSDWSPLLVTDVLAEYGAEAISNHSHD